MKKAWKGIGMALIYLLIYLAVQTGVSIAGMVVMAVWNILRAGDPLALDPAALMDQAMSGVAGLTLLANLVFLLTVWLMFRCEGKSLLQEVRVRPIRPGNLIACILVGISMPYAMSGLLSLLPIPEHILEEFTQQQDLLFEGNAVIGFLAIVIGAPVVEEVLFRGLLYNRLQSGLRPWLAGLLAAMVFGLCHGQSFWMLAAFLMGLLMVWCYEKTGSLWGSIVIHAINNGLSFLEAYVPQPDGLILGILTIVMTLVLIGTLVYLFLTNRKPAAAPQLSNSAGNGA